jgi:hypothetical protein
MALNLPNWDFGQNTFNPFESLSQGFNQGVQNRQNYDRMGYENMIKAAEAMLAPQMAEANLQLTQAEALRAPFVGLTGAAQEINSLELVRKIYGDNSSQYKQALNKYNLNNQNLQSQINYRNTLEQTAPQRYAVPVVKNIMAREDLKRGVIPGTDIPVSEKDSKIIRDQLDLAQLKNISDPKTRERVAYAINIDKTMDTFNPKDLTKYAGLGGALSKKLQQGLALTKNESEDYRKYQEALTSVDVLADQIRQFYGTSIQPEIREDLRQLVNPSTWSNNPEIALRKYERLKSLLLNETATLKNLLYTPAEILPNETRFGFDESPMGGENPFDPLGIL